MADEVITTLEQVTTGWLTAVLARSGALKEGAVASLELDDAHERELSTNTKINVCYTAGAQGDLPTRLFLKLVNIDQEDEFFGPSEVNYYARDYLGLTAAPILRSY
ncbi:MAG TPA: hypothetical protein PKE45_24645, partial [Caldilineaceae bacterium]|nr:hypothetical protein [Caldilineaceae bacterium]